MSINIFTIAILVVLITKLCIYLLTYIKTARIINRIPGPYMIPFIGNFYIFLSPKNSMFKIFYNQIRKYKDKPFCRLWFGTNPVVIFYKPENLSILLENSKIAKKSSEYSLMKDWLGDSLAINQDVKSHASRRKLIQPAFHNDILMRLDTVMNERCDVLIKNLEMESNDNSMVDVAKYIRSCTLDIICETTMGYCVDVQNNNNREYVDGLETITSILGQRMTYPWLQFDWIFKLTHGKQYKKCLKTLHEFSEKILNERLKVFDKKILNSDEHRIAFIDLLLKQHFKAPNEFTLQNIQHEIDALIFGGHDTITSAAVWCCFTISNHVNVQKKILDEIESVIGTDNSNKHLSFDTLNKLQYLECVIKETLRMYPPVTAVIRELCKATVIDGYEIPKGTKASIFIYEVHYDKRYFKEPTEFKPERFLLENSQNRHQYSFIPYLSGNRSCIGQRYAQLELKLLIARLFSKFQIECQQSIQEIDLVADIVSKPSKKLKFKLKGRLDINENQQIRV